MNCFQIFAIMNGAAMNIECKCHFYILLWGPKGIFPGAVLLSHFKAFAKLILKFLEECPDYFPKRLHQWAFPPAMDERTFLFALCGYFFFSDFLY